MKLLKEPLVHFLLIGIGLFIAYGFVNSSDLADADNEIVVSAGRIEQLATVFAKTWQRPPTPDELKGLIDDFVLE
ncbi:MAG: xanthine/uracil/vitamin C permease (AzgA family) [Mariniblastus sp.]|jgi:xanthine/uracil/vitamin C permease (AzgA family)